MNTDAYYEIGHSHEYCQDYALSGTYEDMSYAVVSDGCSGSNSRLTDIGARIYCLTAIEVLRFIYEYNKIHETGLTIKEHLQPFIMLRLNKIKETMSLSEDDFDATLLMAIAHKGNVTIVAWGDGSFIATYDNGLRKIITITYEPNMPYYMSYEMNGLKSKEYSKQRIRKNTNLILDIPNTLDSEKIETDYNLISCLCPPNGDVKSPFISDIKITPNLLHISVCSDGISSFQYDPKSDSYKNYPGLSDEKMVSRDLTNFKNTNGVFVKRRIKRMGFLNKRSDVVHMDDLAVSTIAF